MTAPHSGSHDIQHAPTGQAAAGTRPHFPTEEWEQFERSDPTQDGDTEEIPSVGARVDTDEGTPAA